jgi:serine/threonine protein kinase
MEDEDENIKKSGIYELYSNEVLGKGSFGIVYKGIRRLPDNMNTGEEKIEGVAFKKIPQEIINDKTKLDSLSNEIIISSLINVGNKNEEEDKEKKEDKNKKVEDIYKKINENIVCFLDIVDFGFDKYLAYEFCNGGDLKRYLAYFKGFDESMIQFILKQVLTGLQHLHDKKIVHHDIKPENILVELCPEGNDINFDKKVNLIMEMTDRKNRFKSKENNPIKDDELLRILKNSKIKLSDFGLSKYKEQYNKKEISGSPLYIDPNLFIPDSDNETVDSEKVDIWAIGALAYELRFNELPFQPSVPSIDKLIESLDKGIYFIDFKKCNEISKELISFINMCLQRPQKIRPLCDELLFSEFICRDPDFMIKLTIDNYKNEIYPQGDYLKVDGKITMNIDDNRMINAVFDDAPRKG